MKKMSFKKVLFKIQPKYDKRYFKIDLESGLFKYSEQEFKIDSEPKFQVPLQKILKVTKNVVSTPIYSNGCAQSNMVEIDVYN